MWMRIFGPKLCTTIVDSCCEGAGTVLKSREWSCSIYLTNTSGQLWAAKRGSRKGNQEWSSCLDGLGLCSEECKSKRAKEQGGHAPFVLLWVTVGHTQDITANSFLSDFPLHEGGAKTAHVSVVLIILSVCEVPDMSGYDMRYVDVAKERCLL